MSLLIDSVEVDVPEFATCYCPLKGQSHFIRACIGCDAYKGMYDQSKEAPTFDSRYRLLCAAVMPRQITTIGE